MREAAFAGWRRLEHAADAAFGAALNPLRQLGALGFMMFWLLALSGIYLYAVLDTSAGGAWASIDALAREQPFVGGLLRSLHRYAADAFVLLMLAHGLREWLAGHAHGFRRVSWWTGVVLLPLAAACAIGGFWLNWDRLGQYSAISTAEWLDALPLFGAPLVRNFIGVAAVGDRLFSLFVFVHLGVPLLIVFALWFHVQRISRAAVFPPRALAVGSAAALIALAMLKPVASHAPADLSVVPGTLSLDWILLGLHPLVDATSPATVWALLGAASAALIVLPFVPTRAPRVPVAVVDPANCNGCRRCFDDCPYAAVTMVPHPMRRIGRELAQVDTDLCASCGICVGACPSSTPFRSAADLVTGIDMPSAPIDALRATLQRALAAPRHGPAVVVFGCDRGARVDGLAGPDTVALSLMCIGALPPAFVEYALRAGASAVVVAGCRGVGCEFRLGARWTAERLAGTREPHLRAAVPREAVVTVWADRGEEAALHAALARLRADPPAAFPAHG